MIDKQDTVVTEIKIITPDFAARLLNRNSRNRAVNVKRVADIAEAMTKGQFVFNGDTIRIDADGELLDGQHRLHACVKSGVAFRSILITGLPRAVMPTIDQHSKRTIGQVLHIEGFKNANATAAVARLCAGIATGARYSTRLTSLDVIEILERHPGMNGSAARCRKSFPKCGTILGAVHYIASYLGKVEDAELFISVWETGIPHYEGCAAHMARERVMKSNASAGSLSPTEITKLVVGAWNNFEKRIPVSRSFIQADPRIKGWSDIDVFGSIKEDAK